VIRFAAKGFVSRTAAKKSSSPGALLRRAKVD